MKKLLPDTAANSTGSAVAAERYRPYPAYRDSGVEWLGEIPAHWVVVRMWQVSEAISGGTPERDEPRYWDGTIPWVSPKDMKRRLIGCTEERITERGRRNAGLKLIYPPAVLVVVRGMILAHNFPVAVSTVPLTINQDMKALKLRAEIEPRFFGWLLDGISRRILSTVVEKAAHGTRAIRMDHWRIVDFPLPPVCEQRVFADFLDCETGNIDALVAKKERLIELLQEKRTALITRAVTKGVDPDAPMKDSGVEWLGGMPEHWRVSRCKYLCVVRRGASPRPIDDPAYFDGNGDYGWVRISDVTASGQYLEKTAERLSLLGTSRSVALEPGELIVSIAASVGKPVVTKIKCCIHDDFVWLAGLCDDREFFYWTLLSEQPYAGLGKIGTQLNLNTDTIGGVWLPVPPVDEQRTIASYLKRETEKIDALLAKVHEAIDRLKELRTALIAAAVTGKIDVRETPG